MTLIRNESDKRNRVWLSRLDADKSGIGFYKFYSLRECLEKISGQCASRIERMETHALNGQFERIETEIIEFLEQLPKTKQHFLDMIGHEEGRE